MAALLYGSGLRLWMSSPESQGHRLWLQPNPLCGVEKALKKTGSQCYGTLAPERWREHLAHAKAVLSVNYKSVSASVHLSDALAAQNIANAHRAWSTFSRPAKRSIDPVPDAPAASRLGEAIARRSQNRPCLLAEITKTGNCHTLRHSFATHLLETVTIFEPCRSCSVTKTVHDYDLTRT